MGKPGFCGDCPHPRECVGALQLQPRGMAGPGGGPGQPGAASGASRHSPLAPTLEAIGAPGPAGSGGASAGPGRHPGGPDPHPGDEPACRTRRQLQQLQDQCVAGCDRHDPRPPLVGNRPGERCLQQRLPLVSTTEIQCPERLLRASGTPCGNRHSGPDRLYGVSACQRA